METAPSKPASLFPRCTKKPQPQPASFQGLETRKIFSSCAVNGSVQTWAPVTFAEREASAMAEHRECRHCNTEQLIDLVLNSAHHRLRERCERSKIVAVLEEKHGAYDAHGVHSLLVQL